MIYDVIQSLVVLIEKLEFFNKQFQGVYCIFNIDNSSTYRILSIGNSKPNLPNLQNLAIDVALIVALDST